MSLEDGRLLLAQSGQVERRNATAKRWRVFFGLSTLVGIVMLVLLLANITNSAFGMVAIQSKVDPASLAVNGVPLEELDKETLTLVLREHISAGLYRRLENDQPFEGRSRENVLDLIYERVVEPEIVMQWRLYDSLFRRVEVLAEAATDFPAARTEFKSWLSLAFITAPQSANAVRAGVRTAILGSLWTISIAVAFAFPIGVGAATYLEEFANRNGLVNRIIQTNINNLSGVPSIIYGILGLAIFVRALGGFTSGVAFRLSDPSTANGRTIVAAGLTLGLLILPLVIINAQEAIRAVPNTLRQASFGLGATRWQTVWHHVIPNAMGGILTGTILAMSRAIGETAPLVVVGASTYITVDPTSPFSKFTTLPIQIYQWTSRPQEEFRNIAAAAIFVLLALLFLLNGTAIYFRNRLGRRL
ncbi:MAG: phosphate ABC transporter permease PstA [Chloroflexi bacterium]|nr:phosphate ABC transporter permease PstA [Chloroflexota bacterium]